MENEDIQFAIMILNSHLKARRKAVEVNHMLPSQIEEAKGHIEKLDSAIRKIKEKFSA